MDNIYNYARPFESLPLDHHTAIDYIIKVVRFRLKELKEIDRKMIVLLQSFSSVRDETTASWKYETSILVPAVKKKYQVCWTHTTRNNEIYFNTIYYQELK